MKSKKDYWLLACQFKVEKNQRKKYASPVLCVAKTHQNHEKVLFHIHLDIYFHLNLVTKPSELKRVFDLVEKEYRRVKEVSYL